MGSSSLTAFHPHAGAASHQLLGELPSADQDQRSFCRPVHPSLWQEKRDFSACRMPVVRARQGCPVFSPSRCSWRIVGKSGKKDTLCKSPPCLFGLGKRKPVAFLSPQPSAARREVVKEQRWASEKRQIAGACRQGCPDSLISKRVFKKWSCTPCNTPWADEARREGRK